MACMHATVRDLNMNKKFFYESFHIEKEIVENGESNNQQTRNRPTYKPKIGERPPR